MDYDLSEMGSIRYDLFRSLHTNKMEPYIPLLRKIRGKFPSVIVYPEQFLNLYNQTVYIVRFDMDGLWGLPSCVEPHLVGNIINDPWANQVTILESIGEIINVENSGQAIWILDINNSGRMFNPSYVVYNSENLLQGRGSICFTCASDANALYRELAKWVTESTT